MRIRVTSVPDGVGPRDIETTWIDLVLPIVSNANPMSPRTAAFPNGTRRGRDYEVAVWDAIRLLREAGRNEAADWWNFRLCRSDFILVFDKEFCEVVE